MANILILNGSPRKNGKTASLVNAFSEGAQDAGNEVKELYLQGLRIGGCLACESCQRSGNGCAQKDDMDFAVIKQFAHGGMSSGGVDNRWWLEKGIPLLKNRLAAL